MKEISPVTSPLLHFYTATTWPSIPTERNIAGKIVGHGFPDQLAESRPAYTRR
jgi:hypothetical protein